MYMREAKLLRTGATSGVTSGLRETSCKQYRRVREDVATVGKFGVRLKRRPADWGR